MIELSSESLADAFSACYGGFSRTICIAFNNWSKYQDFAGSILGYTNAGLLLGARSQDLQRSSKRICFDTGSTISVEYYKEASRLYGQRYDKIIYDEDVIGDPFLWSYLSSSERYPGDLKSWGGTFLDYQNTSRQPVEHADYSELDGFLDSFGIHS